MKLEGIMSASQPPIDDFQAHALAIEREAAARYREFAARMSDRDQPALAELFERLARMEQAHAAALEQRFGAAPADDATADDLPASEYRWLDAGKPETAAHDWVFRLLTPHDALRIALTGEQRARDFFQRVADGTTNPELQALAQDMANEEVEHAEKLERALEHVPDPHIDWEKLLR
jgi:rubrerythrin